MHPLKYMQTGFSDKMVGSLWATGDRAVKRICARMNLNRPCTVVEYGPGSGVFTRYILNNMHPDGKLIAIETNKQFITELQKINDPRLHLFYGSVSFVRSMISDLGLQEVDYVISGIPFTLLSPQVKRHIVASTFDILGNNGQFLVYQFSTHVKKYLKEYFKVKSSVIPHIPIYFLMQAVKPDLASGATDYSQEQTCGLHP